MRVGFRFQPGDVDRQRGKANSSVYLIEIKDNIHQFCAGPGSRKFQTGGLVGENAPILI
jgi:hypothetical protein